MTGFDTHSNIATYLDERTNTMNEALQAFTDELKSQEVWNDVTTVFISECKCTITFYLTVCFYTDALFLCIIPLSLSH